jgi:hypothetical protein
VRPDGPRERLGVASGSPPLFRVTDTPRAGVYRIVPEGKDTAGTSFALTPDPRETESLAALDNAAVDDLLGFKSVHAIAGQDPNAWASSERLNREWTLWLLVVLLVMLVGETTLAWFCGRAW